MKAYLDTFKLLLSRKARGGRKIAALACGGFVVANLAVYLAFVAPASARLEERERLHAEMKKHHAEAVLFQKQKEAFAGIRAGIPTQKDMPLLVKEFVHAARSHRLSVSAINYDIPRHGPEGLTMLSFSFPAEGAYPDVKRFIYEIETTDRLVGIQDLKLDSDKGRVRLQMKLLTYIRGE
jgi:Tfp pilus assembly protein PilO